MLLRVGGCGFGLRAAALGALSKLLRLGGSAGLLADLGRPLQRFHDRRVVWAEHLLANRQRAMQTAARTGQPNVN